MIHDAGPPSSLRRTVDKIRQTLVLNDSDFIEVVGMKLSTFQRIKRGQADYTLRHIETLCHALDLNISLVFSGDIDYVALSKAFAGDYRTVPERYANPKQQVARVRAVRSMIHFAGVSRSYEFAGRILSRLQLVPEQLLNPDDFISPLIGIDLLREFKTEGMADESFKHMGNMTLGVIRDSRLGKDMAEKESPTALYRAIFEEFGDSFDRLWSYRLIKINAVGCTMEVRQQESTSDSFASPVIGNRQTCLFLQGVFSSFLGTQNNRYARLLETECMYQGGARCVYHLHWD